MLEYEVVHDAERLGHIANEIDHAGAVKGAVGLDIETTSLSPLHGDIRLLQCHTGKSNYVIDLYKTQTLGPVAEALSGEAVKIIQTAKFEQKWLLYKHGVELWPLFDTHRASAMIHNGKNLGHNLYDLYKRELNLTPEVGDQGRSDWSAPELTKEQLDYAAEDTTYLHSLRDKLKPQLSASGLNRVAVIEFGAILGEAAIELQGFRLDAEKWLALADSNVILERELRTQLDAMMPHPKGQMSLMGIPGGFNLNSPQQIQQSFALLGIDLKSTSKESLGMVAYKHPAVPLFMKHRAVAKRLSSFGPDFLKYIDPLTGRIHVDFWALTGAGRYSCCIPKRSRIATSRGVIPIGEVTPGDLVQTADGPRKVLGWSDSGTKPVLRFHLSDGRSVDYTKEHRVLSDGVWKEAGELSVGDVVYVSGTEGPSPTSYPSLPDGDQSRSRRAVRFPKKLTEDVAFVFGHYVAEGCIGFNKQRPRKRPTKHTQRLSTGDRIPAKVIVAFGHQEEDLRDFVEGEWCRLFGVEPKRTEGSSPDIHFAYLAVGQWLLDVGCGGLAHEKRVPSSVWLAPNSVKLAFLRGLFEGDGGTTTGYPRLSTESPVLAEEVGELLSSLGIHFSLHCTGRGRLRIKSVVSVLAQSLDRCRDLLWSASKKGNIFESSDRRLIHSGVVKPSFLDGCYLYERVRDEIGWENFCQARAWRLKEPEVRLTSSMLRVLGPLATSDTYTDLFIRGALARDLRSVVIVRVEILPSELVCDIEVEDNQQFLLNGVVTHNSKPNLQQIPRTDDFRGCFATLPGRVLVACDYGQVELCIAAEISGDKTLRGIYQKGEDAHRRTAAIVAGCSYEEVTKEQRQAAKPVNFGLIYGLGAARLVIYSQVSYGVTISMVQAKQFIKRYFEGYSGVRRWHERTLRDAERTHMARTLWGRLRYLDPDKARNEFFNCLDDQTEALTRRGWVKGFDLTEDDALLTKNAETGRLEWQKPTELKKWPDYEGPLVEFRSRSFNAVSTPNHRWLVYDKGMGRDVCKTTAELSSWGDHRIHRTGYYERHPGRERIVEQSHLDFAELCGWFLTDGSFFMSGTNKTRPTAMIYQSERGNSEKVKRIDALLDRLQAVTGRYVTESTGQVQWRLTREWSEHLNKALPGKLLSEDFLVSLESDALHQLFDAMMAGDGHVDAGGKQTFCAGTKEAADAFQVLCTLCGFASNQHARDMSKYKPRSDKMQNVPKMGTVYYVTVLRRDQAQVTAKQRREYVAKTPIWCPIVPNTYFVARREGQVFVTGNTPVQGSGADGLKRALPMVYHKLKKYGGKAFMVHMVHDEIIVECDDDPEMIAGVKADLQECMLSAIQPMLPHVPVTADPASGPSWATVH